MNTKKLTKTSLAKEIGISHSAIVQWENAGKIPAEQCFVIAPIIKVKPEKLWDNPRLLFDMFNSTKTQTKKAG